MGKKYRVAVVGDLHFPFHKASILRLIFNLLEKVQPDIIVQAGDLYDQISFSRFARRMFMTPDEEMGEARIFAESFWDRCRTLCPNAKLFQLKGNHDMRRLKSIIEKSPEHFGELNHDDMFKFHMVETIHDVQEALIINDIAYFHGHRKFGDHLKDVQYQHHVVCGHLHRGATHFERIGAQKGKIRWEANAGYVGDPFHEALNYRPLKKYFTWTHGLLLIEDQWPSFIPLEM